MKKILFALLGCSAVLLVWLGDSSAILNAAYGSGSSGLGGPRITQDGTNNGYSLVPLTAGLVDPVALAFLPAGDLLVAERGSGEGENGLSAIRMIRGRTLLPEPVLTVSTNVAGTSGIHGIAVDPNFGENGYIYVYYGAGINAKDAGGPTRNRLSRFTLTQSADGTAASADPNSELVVLDDLRWSERNNGGGLAFGDDGLLYLGTGDTEQPQHARKLDRSSGKIMRIRPTESGYEIPADNPFVNEGEALPEIFAYGFRNPVALTGTPNGSTIFVADQGESTHEEINWLVPGENYGWPNREGKCPRGQNSPEACQPDERYTDPIGDYGHGAVGRAIRGLAYVDSGRYHIGAQGDILFVDGASNVVGSLTPAAETIRTLLNSGGSLRGLAYHNGYLYTLNGATGELMLLYYNLEELTGAGSMQPTAGLTADQASAVPGTVVTLMADSSTDPKDLGLSYQWDFGDGSAPVITDSPMVSHTYMTDGIFTAAVTVTDLLGDVSEPALVTLSFYGGELPEIVLENATEPGRALYYSGDRFNFRAERESGVSGLNEQMPYRWRIDLHHTDAQGDHIHALSNFTDAEGLLRLRLTDEHNEDPDIFYRFHLTMTTEEGLEISSFKDLAPELAALEIQSEPGPATITLNDSSYQLPYTRTVIAGQSITLSAAPTTLTSGGIGEFAYWHIYTSEWPVTAFVPEETIIYSRTTTIDASYLDTNITAHYEYARPAETTFLPFLSGLDLP